jgi:hypothetical protein
MTYALIQNNMVAEYPYTLQQFNAANPNVSLPQSPTEAQLNEFGIYTVIPTQPPVYNPITQNLNEITPEQKWGEWYQAWSVTSATSEEVEYRQANARAENVAYGSQLLTNTDWTAIASIADPLECNPYLANRQAFLEYRNQVRNIVLNPPVDAPVWPTPPSEDWQPSPEPEVVEQPEEPAPSE